MAQTELLISTISQAFLPCLCSRGCPTAHPIFQARSEGHLWLFLSHQPDAAATASYASCPIVTLEFIFFSPSSSLHPNLIQALNISHITLGLLLWSTAGLSAATSGPSQIHLSGCISVQTYKSDQALSIHKPFQGFYINAWTSLASPTG